MNVKLLVVDDDEISLMLTDLLVEENIFFQKSQNFLDGKYALEDFKINYSKDEIYAIILDINMPLMNGWEFLDNIKDFALNKNTFVFMLSSSSDRKDIEKAENNQYVRDFFNKPLEEKHLASIQEVVKK